MIAPARAAAFDALTAIDDASSDLGSAVAGARRRLTDARDQALVLELVAGTLRMRGAIDYQLALRSSRPLDKLDGAVLRLLRLAAFQILYLTKVPASAVVNDAVALTRKRGVTSASGLVNAVLRALVRERDALVWPSTASAADLAVRYSHPEWLVSRWLARYGADGTARWLQFNNVHPSLCLATNVGRITRDALQARLLAEGVETVATTTAPDGLVVITGAALSTAAFDEGLFVVQDEASQLIAGLVAAAPGSRVLDLCAAPGGKTVALAARVGGTGLVVATDVRPRRVRLLRATLDRAQAAHVSVAQIAPTGPLPFGHGRFDAVLIDAPCSGLGTLRRDPDIRWRRTAADLPRLATTQGTLLTRTADLVRPGGTLVYSTCSSEPEENEQVVAAFVAADPRFALVRTHTTLPHRDGLEAFFGAVLARAL